MYTFNTNCISCGSNLKFVIFISIYLYYIVDIMALHTVELHRPIRVFRLQFAIEHRVKLIILQTIGELLLLL